MQKISINVIKKNFVNFILLCYNKIRNKIKAKTFKELIININKIGKDGCWHGKASY